MPVGPYDFERYPSLGDDIIVPASRLVEIPDNIDFAIAVTIPAASYPRELIS